MSSAATAGAGRRVSAEGRTATEKQQRSAESLRRGQGNRGQSSKRRSSCPLCPRKRGTFFMLSQAKKKRRKGGKEERKEGKKRRRKKKRKERKKEEGRGKEGGQGEEEGEDEEVFLEDQI